MLVDFPALVPPETPNWYAACPPGWAQPWCREPAPVFDLPLQSLERDAMAVIAALPRVSLLDHDRQDHQALFEQRTPVFGFTDRILIGFVSLPDGRASLVIYSRSQVGRWDLGKNRARVRDWISVLKRQLQPDIP